MNSSIELISVAELRKVILDIDNCHNIKTEKYEDGSEASYECCMESMCDDCINRFAGLLEWAEDFENEKNEPASSN